MLPATLVSTGLTRRWPSACYSRLILPVETSSPPPRAIAWTGRNRPVGEQTSHFEVTRGAADRQFEDRTSGRRPAYPPLLRDGVLYLGDKSGFVNKLTIYP